MLLDLIGRDETEFPIIPRPRLVTGLRVMHSKFRSLAPIAAFENLQELSIIDLRESDLEFLRPCRQLRYLRICHLPQVSGLEPLSHLQNLEVLSLSTLPSWDSSRRTQVVESLEPISRMPALCHLDLLGVRPLDRSLHPLEPCPQLRTALFHLYPKAEQARFFAATGVVEQRTPPARGLPEATTPSTPFPGARWVRRLLLEGRLSQAPTRRRR